MASQPLVKVVLLLVLVGAGVGVWYGLLRQPAAPPVVEPATLEARPDAAPTDPRLTFDTPYRNVKPDVKYVGDAACAVCHQTIDATYHQHPMGRSAAKVGAKGSPENYTSNNPFEAQGFTLRAEKTPAGDRHVLSAKDTRGQPLPDHAMLATVAIGSGTRGRSYLAFEEGTVYQTPVSWFGQNEQKWDLSPGFDLELGGRRPVVEECLFCHVNSAEFVPGSVNRLKAGTLPEQLNVGCERCHGPGELHVRERTDGQVPPGRDTSIVNPKHLSPELRSGICRQCHLKGEERITRRGRSMTEFRPGLPWELFVSTFVRHPSITDYHQSVGQFEQMHVSKCFTASGKMDCVTCHDPHKKPDAATSAAYYRGRCATCHDSQACKAPAADRTAAGDNCVQCHMPRTKSSTIVHTAVTDHRVVRRPLVKDTARKTLPFDADPVVLFGGSSAVAKDELDRDLALAFGRTTLPLPANLSGSSLLQLAEGRLKHSLTTWPGDSAAWGLLSKLHGKLKRPDLGRAAARNAYELAPDSDTALSEWIHTLTEAEEYAEALPLVEKLVERNPRLLDVRVRLVTTLMSLERWPQAEAAARAALTIQPLHAGSRLYLALCLYKQGHVTAGNAEAEIAAHLRPRFEQKMEYQRWYAEHTRSR